MSMSPEIIVWQKAGRDSLYHVNNGYDRPVCNAGGKPLAGLVAPAAFKPHGPARVNGYGQAVYPPRAPVCLRCKAWLEKRGRWPDDSGL